jgi:hypothetical protein
MRLKLIQIPRHLAIAAFSLLAGLWIVLFMSDAGNFWHGGTVVGLVLTEAAAAFGILAFVEVLRSDASRLVKAALAIPAAPLVLFTAFGLFYAVQRAVAV